MRDAADYLQALLTAALTDKKENKGSEWERLHAQALELLETLDTQDLAFTVGFLKNLKCNDKYRDVDGVAQFDYYRARRQTADT